MTHLNGGGDWASAYDGLLAAQQDIHRDLALREMCGRISGLKSEQERSNMARRMTGLKHYATAQVVRHGFIENDNMCESLNRWVDEMQPDDPNDGLWSVLQDLGRLAQKCTKEHLQDRCDPSRFDITIMTVLDRAALEFLYTVRLKTPGQGKKALDTGVRGCNFDENVSLG